MNFKITVKHIWNKLRLYLSFLLFVFYLIIGILFLFTDTWIDFLPQGREIIGSALVLFGVLRLYIAYRRYKKKHNHITTQSSKKKKQLIEEPQKHLFLITALIIFYGCSADKNAPTDTPTSGEVTIVVDESFQQLFNTEIYTFQSLYQNAKVHARYLPESEALQRLINDSCKVVVMCRDLTDNERKQFEQANIFPISTKIAEDAIAFVVNNENTDTTMTVEKMKSILLGNDSLWDWFQEKTIPMAQRKINIVFDNNGSANTSYIKDSLLDGKPFSKNAFAVNSNPEVIDYVSKNKNAIGVLSVNWISDSDDTLTLSFLKKIKVIALAKDSASKAVKPYQAYIKTKDYPFTRDVYMINRQTRAGLGMGFVSFVAGEKGQLMILKAGLVPAIAPVRLIEINTK